MSVHIEQERERLADRTFVTAATGSRALSGARCSKALSIFHEPWWLDIATGGNWAKASVMHGKQLLGEMPYCITRKGMWRVSRLPPLTRTLGPVIAPMAIEPAHQFRHELRVMSHMIEQLPEVDNFFQVFDYHVHDALAFALHGFTVTSRYTFQISPQYNPTELWARMDARTRNVIRSAGQVLKVVPIEDPGEFLSFYEANLESQSRHNAYGSAAMGELVRAFVGRAAGGLFGAYTQDGRLAGAIGLVWDQQTMYFLLSTRARRSHNGTMSILLWTAIQDAINRHLTFDFDGFSGAATFSFLNGFGGSLIQRLGVERAGKVYELARMLKRMAPTRTKPAFAHHL